MSRCALCRYEVEIEIESAGKLEKKRRKGDPFVESKVESLIVIIQTVIGVNRLWEAWFLIRIWHNNIGREDDIDVGLKLHSSRLRDLHFFRIQRSRTVSRA